jgi:hypothetical protein
MGLFCRTQHPVIKPTELNSMLCYYPHEGATERITWHGGESTMLHYQVQVDDYKGDPDWIERESQTFMGGMPCGTKELLAAMSDYYQSIVQPY